MAKNNRNLQGIQVQDPGILHNLEYNDPAGSKKVTNVGPHLLPIPVSASAGVTTYSTNVTAATALPGMGKLLAVYNNSGTVASVTLGEDSTITALAVGVTDVKGHVGIACTPNSWTYIACGVQNWVIASAATALVYLVDDNTYIRQEATK